MRSGWSIFNKNAYPLVRRAPSLDTGIRISSKAWYSSTNTESRETFCPDYEVKTDLKEDRDIQETQDTIRYSYNGLDSRGNPKINFSLRDYFKGNIHHSHNVLYGYSASKNSKKDDKRSFVDLKIIRAKSGRGGNGCVAFFRDAFRATGPPNGGDGGNGGDVYIQAVNNVTSLHRVVRTYQARSGQPGKGNQLDGKKGEDIIIEVPVGTTVRWIPDPIELKKAIRAANRELDDVSVSVTTAGSNNEFVQFYRQCYLPGKGWIFKERDEEYYMEKDFFKDLNDKVTLQDIEITDEEIYEDIFPLNGIDFDKPMHTPVLLLKGGKGGQGNMHFLTKDIRNPRFCKQGREGLTHFFLLELKLIADLGLVGLPNAGKSTLLRAISRARPRVGSWEFTTLQPTIGTIFTSIDKDPFTVADIPGIIKGASENKGMGLDFLRHIERSGGLVFVVSVNSENPVSDLLTLLHEVGEQRMKDKKVLVVATKADLETTSEKFRDLKSYTDSNGWKIVPVSAINGENIEACIQLMAEAASKQH
ncbi:Piso0_002735 [Millerozyma farinosa CBS 7064]|uniref:Piso0_002735 protein n=1 Tax=Pichia sorbitophila (strain ATCC MYA-4447 / BCRC 22081 / CBS 7064 / NBRC 10061 / NRRL Y-12695) TaxID=559304 RepID=G8YDD4_PICSO|nr:Piso0_002735 [Millerozyma farinosa CBS 7064]